MKTRAKLIGYDQTNKVIYEGYHEVEFAEDGSFVIHPSDDGPKKGKYIYRMEAHMYNPPPTFFFNYKPPKDEDED